MNNAAIIAQTMNNAGFDVLPMEMDLSSRSSILSLIDEAQKHGEISMLVNVAGVSVKSRTCFPKNMYDFCGKHVRVFLNCEYWEIYVFMSFAYLLYGIV